MRYKCAIVDDEPLALDILESYIRRTTYLQLITRTNKLQTIEKLVADKEVDVVLMDVNMRGVRRESIENLLQKDCLFILVTAYPISEIQNIGWKTGQGYLAKPASYRKFVSEMERLINN
ncbi:response regulator [Chitinophaga nivalis]|uniref:Response regulator n=1 Tax=Chitinophaga nivalis TaxID=2991709 RepID=A0ABT3ITZ4_9BACT|nr:response regulator [Chitinophaga nivalis]MCW3462843.1 response regulator [Chitinophaga nivalis]MCW3487467.1 response regulator [Chitinophaga nivalis]